MFSTVDELFLAVDIASESKRPLRQGLFMLRYKNKTKQTTLVIISSSPEAKRMMELRIFQVKIKPGQKYLLYFFVRVYLFYGMDWPILVAWLFSGPNVIPDNC